jgi:hypothetical protein
MSVFAAAGFGGYFDLQVFEDPLQVKTAACRARSSSRANFFRFQIIGAVFAWPYIDKEA